MDVHRLTASLIKLFGGCVVPLPFWEGLGEGAKHDGDKPSP